jgi:hypothetical protein
MSHDAAIVELREHAGTQFDPDLVALFCDLYTDHAPSPDPTILAMTTPEPRQLIRRERRAHEVGPASETMAADGHGLVALEPTDPPPARTRTGGGPPADKSGIAAS